MIYRKDLRKIFEGYISEVFNIPGKNDLEFGPAYMMIREFATHQYEPMIDPSIPLSMTFSAGRLEIRTGFSKSHYMYLTEIFLYIMGKKLVFKFQISKEAWCKQSLFHCLTEVMHEVEEAGLIKLTPEEESQKSYAEAKKKHFAAMYGAEQSTQYMAGLKKEIKALQDSIKMNAKPQKWVVQDPNGNMHVASPDMGQQVLHNIFAQADAAQADEYIANSTMFNHVQQWAKEFYKLHGHFPEGPEEFECRLHLIPEFQRGWRSSIQPILLSNKSQRQFSIMAMQATS